MKKSSVRIAALGVASALLIGGMSVSPAWAYFTDSHETEGGIQISVAPSSDIEEEWDKDGKHVYIKNTSESVPLYVRAKVFVSDEQASTISGDNWTQSGDWWYWGKVLQPGQYTDELNVKMTYMVAKNVIIIAPDGSRTTVPVETPDGQNFNCVVVYEAVPVKPGVDSAQAAFANS